MLEDASAGTIDTLSVTAVTDPAHGTATLSGSEVTYTPDPGYLGSDSFEYTLSAAPFGLTVAVVAVQVVSDPSGEDDVVEVVAESVAPETTNTEPDPTVAEPDVSSAEPDANTEKSGKSDDGGCGGGPASTVSWLLLLAVRRRRCNAGRSRA